MRVIFFFIISIFLSCSSNETSFECVSFDHRQCMGDPWGEDVDINGSADDMAVQLEVYLSTNYQISINDIRVAKDHHSIVCEACFVCPQGPRYFVQASPEDIEKFRAIDLLNVTFDSCEEF